MKTILLVEDDPSIAETFSMIFEGEHYKVKQLISGESLLNDRYELPDLFVVDKQIVGVDGVDICRHLKHSSYSKHIPVVMMSASPDIEPLAKAVGADDVLIKPYNLAALRAMVERYTGSVKVHG